MDPRTVLRTGGFDAPPPPPHEITKKGVGMTVLRAILHSIAVVTGGIAVITWTLGLLPQAGVAGAISALSILLAEAIWWCSQDRERMRQGREAVLRRRIEEPMTGRWTVPDDYWPDEHRPVWPNSAGAPE